VSDGYRWLFIGNVPLLYDKIRVARQWNVEASLDPKALREAVGVKKLEENVQEKVNGYVS